MTSGLKTAIRSQAQYSSAGAVDEAIAHVYSILYRNLDINDTQRQEEVRGAISSIFESFVGSQYLERLYQQGKEVSQIIAYIWLWGDSQDNQYEHKKRVAQKLAKYFLFPTHEDTKFEALLSANPYNPDLEGGRYKKEAALLHAVFCEDGLDNSRYIFPLMSDYELGKVDPGIGYKFILDFNEYFGGILDATENYPHLMNFHVPYPPRPELGELTVTRPELGDWIQDRQPKKYYPPTPFIPACST